jgi:hypothetical protein
MRDAGLGGDQHSMHLFDLFRGVLAAMAEPGLLGCFMVARTDRDASGEEALVDRGNGLGRRDRPGGEAGIIKLRGSFPAPALKHFGHDRADDAMIGMPGPARGAPRDHGIGLQLLEQFPHALAQLDHLRAVGLEPLAHAHLILQTETHRHL